MEPMERNLAIIDGGLQDFHNGEFTGFTIYNRTTFSNLTIVSMRADFVPPCMVGRGE